MYFSVFPDIPKQEPSKGRSKARILCRVLYCLILVVALLSIGYKYGYVKGYDERVKMEQGMTCSFTMRDGAGIATELVSHDCEMLL